MPFTKDDCQRQLDKNNGVCERCGGALVPIQTVDNSGEPTFWGGCEACCVFDWGTPWIVHAIAKRLVTERNFVPYHHLSQSDCKTEEDKQYWIQSQTAGACSIVQDVLSILNTLRP